MSFKGLTSRAKAATEAALSSSPPVASLTSQNSQTDAGGGTSGGQSTSFKVVMVGDSGVGKSCVLEKLLDLGSTNQFISTIGVDVRTHTVSLGQGKSLKLQVWDTGGQQRYRPVLSTCYRGAHGVIVVFDVTNGKSFANLPQWLKEVAEFSNSDAPTSPAKLLIGNKSDLEERREVEREQAEEFARDNGMAYIETSAVRARNIREAFLALVSRSDAGPALATTATTTTTNAAAGAKQR